MHTVRYILIGWLFLAISFSQMACSANRVPQSPIYEVTGSQAERVSAITPLIAKHQQPPTLMLDAHFVQEQLGDGILGPSDYRSFYMIEVSPEDIGEWQAMLSPLDSVPAYQAPSPARSWWIGEEVFASLYFYEPSLLTGSTNGWVALSPQTGYIYIFSFTT
jgi:hypothetical protein